MIPETAGTKCPVCSSERIGPAFQARGAGLGEAEFLVQRCFACGLGWTDPAPADDQIGRWYPPAYYGKDNVRFNPFFEWLVRWFRRRRARVIARLVPGGPILDIGCGRGFMLSFLRQAGFEPHGVELNEAAAWHARNRLSLEVHVGSVLDAPYGPEQFQAVVLWHSLEHMRFPERILAHAKQVLKPGGLLVVAVPNSDSLQARWFGNRWFHLDVPRHYFHFGSRSLKGLLSKLGFEIVREDHFSVEQNPYGWLQSIYNALGFDFDFLYGLIKNRTSRMFSIRKHPVQALLSVALLPGFLVLALVMTVIETAVRRGGTIAVYAVKKESSA